MARLMETSMRWIACAAAAAIALQAAGASAGVATVGVVKSGSATLSADGRTLVVSASVDLSNGCITNPRVQAPDPSVQPDASGMVTLSVAVDSSAGPGQMCSMIYRPNVAATPLQWIGPPRGVKSVQLIGVRTPFVAPVTGAAAAASAAP
jgi:hypothetical protein